MYIYIIIINIVFEHCMRGVYFAPKNMFFCLFATHAFSSADLFHLLFWLAGQFQNLLVEKRGEKCNVAVIKLNRPKALNALCDALMAEMAVALQDAEQDKNIGCIVITGSEKAFAGKCN